MKTHTLVGIIIILVGLSILFHFAIFNFIFAFIILWIGVRILTGQGSGASGFTETRGTIHDNSLRRVLIFSGINAKLESDKFESAELVTIFGGGKLDARNIKTNKKDVDIELVAIFGGIKVLIPKGWKVESEGTGILGGFDNKTGPGVKNGVTVHLKGTAIFGGVEVFN